MFPLDQAKEWLLRRALAKGVRAAVQAGAAWLMAKNAAAIGIQVDPDALAAGILAGLEVARNWLKQKKGWSWL